MDMQVWLIIAAVAGFFMAWGVGANDVANAMGTSVGSKALTLGQAMIIAGVFEVAGALLAGGQVTDTLRGGILDAANISITNDWLIEAMLAALLSAGTWLLIASFMGWPVSTTHSIVGAIIGVGLKSYGVDAIVWHTVLNIGLSWIVTPLISACIAYITFIGIQRQVLQTNDPFEQAKRWLPIYAGIVIFVIALVTLSKGLKHVGLPLTHSEAVVLSLAVGFFGSIIAKGLTRYLRRTENGGHNLMQAEKVFARLMLITACSMAFAHGSNDVANAIGPLAAVVAALDSQSLEIAIRTPIPFWVMLIGAGGIAVGLASYGYRVMATIGERITDLTPSRGFSAEFATATTVILASGLGLPISTTQTLVGAVLGVGAARGIGALNLNVVRNIFLSWVITLPAAGVMALIFHQLLVWFAG